MKVLGINAAWTSILFVVARFVDAFTDITMGRIADKKKPGKYGKFRQWLRWICAPVALASFLMYQSSMVNAPMTIRIIYMFVTYLLWGSIFYTAINIPYGSMASVISDSSEDRASLSTFRSIGSVIANLVVGVGAPLLIYTTDEAGNQIVQGGRFTLIAAVFSVLALICYLICFYTTTERVRIEPKATDKQLTLGQTLKGLVTSRAMIGIILASIGILAASIMTQTINQFLFIDYFKDNRGISVMTILSMIPSIVLAPFAVPLSKRFGKREIGIFGSLCAGLSYLVLFIIRTQNMWVFIIINTIGFLGFGVFNLIMYAIIIDIIDDQEVKTGAREDGTIYGAYSFARKIGQAIAGGLGSGALVVIGYNEAVQVQTESVVQGIYTVASLIPAILYFVVALALLFIYPLSKKKVEENNAFLKAKREGSNA